MSSKMEMTRAISIEWIDRSPTTVEVDAEVDLNLRIEKEGKFILILFVFVVYYE